MKSFSRPEENIAYERFDPYAEEYAPKPEQPAVNPSRYDDDFPTYEPITLSRTNTVAIRESTISKPSTNDDRSSSNPTANTPAFSAMLPSASEQFILPADFFNPFNPSVKWSKLLAKR
ncbi:MAG: hypothetical protein HC912_06145 [Saprospiraceae bacterium]|nr:hypothetical protein [Saprospiraceae bacterium]